MGAIGRTICYSSGILLELSEALLKDVDPKTCGRFPGTDGNRVNTNHPSFIFGHLALYPARAVALFGLETNPLAAPAGFAELFEPGIDCRDDADGSIYPEFGNIYEVYVDLHTKCNELLEKLPDDAFDQESPDERYRERFPKILDAANFLLNDHAAFHLGQLSAWRRVMGLGSAM